MPSRTFALLLAAAAVVGIVPSASRVAAPRVGESDHPAAAEPTVVTFRATDYAFMGPTSVKSGTVTFRLVNGGKEIHHLSVVQLSKGKTLADYMKAVGSGKPPAWGVDVGGPNAAAPGDTVSATLTLAAGEYALICWVHSPDQTQHVNKGMVGSLTVLRARSADAPPVADVEIRLSDYAFGLSRPLTAGRHVVRVVNDAEQSHEVVLVKYARGKSTRDMDAWFAGGMKGPPPGKPIDGIAPLAKGRSGYFTVDLTPGAYQMICFIPDAKDGKPHSEHGMVVDFEVAGK